MPAIRMTARPALFFAAFALVTGSACMPPVAFHDGLPAWAPEAGGVEWRIGYQRLSAFGADSFDFIGQPFTTPDFGVSYLTPGVRMGLKRAPKAADVGLVSVITAGGGNFSALIGAEFGLGHSDPKVSVIFRPSVYLLDIYHDAGHGVDVQTGFWSQASLLIGTGYRTRGVNFAIGGRANPFGAGPVAVVGVNLRPVELRTELSFMLPIEDYACGRVLTVGLTAAAPTRPEPKRWHLR